MFFSPLGGPKVLILKQLWSFSEFLSSSYWDSWNNQTPINNEACRSYETLWFHCISTHILLGRKVEPKRSEGVTHKTSQKWLRIWTRCSHRREYFQLPANILNILPLAMNTSYPTGNCFIFWLTTKGSLKQLGMLSIETFLKSSLGLRK